MEWDIKLPLPLALPRTKYTALTFPYLLECRNCLPDALVLVFDKCGPCVYRRPRQRPDTRFENAEMRLLSVEVISGIIWTLAAFAGLLTAGRVYIHWHKNEKLRWDDHFNALAFLALVGWCVTYEVFVPNEHNTQLYEMGLITKKPPPIDPRRDMALDVTNQCFFWLAVYTVRASFLAMYWHIFETSTRFRIFWWAITLFIGLAFLASWFAIFMRCGRIQDFMNTEVCGNRSFRRGLALQLNWCLLNVTCDLLLVALPTANLRGLLMRTSQKIGLSLIFGLVAFDIIFDVLRVTYTLKSDLAGLPDQNVLWVAFVPIIAVIVCALPSYGGLLIRRRNELDLGMDDSFLRNYSVTKVFRELNSRPDEHETRPLARDGSLDNNSRSIAIVTGRRPLHQYTNG